MLITSAKLAISSSDVQFEISKHQRFSPTNKEYTTVCLSWYTKDMVKGLAECGNITDKRNMQFAEWLLEKLSEAKKKRDSMPFLATEPLVSSAPAIETELPTPYPVTISSTQPVRFISTITAQPGPGYTYYIHQLGWQEGLVTKVLANCGNTRDPRNKLFTEWAMNKLLSDYFNGDEMPFLPPDFPIA
jgi:hypothetical protein